MNAVVHKKRHAPFEQQDPNELLPRLIVTGSVLYKNTNGYLTADQVPFIGIYQFLTISYIMMFIVWVYYLHRFRDTLIDIHQMIVTVLFFALLECLLNLTMYYYRNIRPAYIGEGLFSGIMIIQDFRVAFSRIVSLAVALGY